MIFIFYGVAVVTNTYLPFFTSDIEDRTMALRNWRPYSLENVNYYYLSYLHQSWGVTMSASIHAATEALFMGFMMKICGQIKIFEKRINRLPKTLNDLLSTGAPPNEVKIEEKRLIIELIHNHLRIYE